MRQTYNPAHFRISHTSPTETAGDCQQKCQQRRGTSPRGGHGQENHSPGALLNRAASVSASRSISARVREAVSLPPPARARAAVPMPALAAMGMRRMPEVRTRGRGQARWEWSGFSWARSFALPSRGFTLGNRGGRHRR